MPDIEDKLNKEVKVIVDAERDLTLAVRQLEDELRADNPKFQAFIEKQAALRLVQDQSADTWKRIETAMIENGIKSIKSDEWGSITVAERNNYAVADIKMLPAKFKKTVPDTTKIGQAYKLEGKPPKGVLVSVSQYLVKRLK